VSRPIIALLTDFGWSGQYVGAMKGAILTVFREVDLVDITHDIPPQDLATGAMHLMAVVPFFPAGTIFLTVVDPGVGTARAALAARAGGHVFVGPDNGVMAPVLDELGATLVVSIDDPARARPTVSRTFEGRDRLGPAAAWMASGVPLESLGPVVLDYRRLESRRAMAAPDRLFGEVVWVDRFGNLITNITRGGWAEAAQGRAGEVTLNGAPVGAPVGTYADAEPGDPCVLFGSTEQLEIAVRNGNAAQRLDAASGARVEVVWR
jgi:S-adenosyl-L-methionine hydrolase (adenosine-forming)